MDNNTTLEENSNNGSNIKNIIIDWVIRNLIVNKRNNYIIYGIVLGLLLVDFLFDGYKSIVPPLTALIIFFIHDMLRYWYNRVLRKNESILKNIKHLIETRKYAEAFEQANLIKIIEPQIIEKKYFVAIAYMQLDNPQEALKIFDSIESECSRSSIFLYNKGVALTAIGENIEAIEYLTRALEMEKSWHRYQHRGLAYKNIDKNEEAEIDLRESVKLKEEPSNTCNLGMILEGKGEYEEAMKLYNRSIEMQYESPIAFYNRAILRQKINELELAIKDFDLAYKFGSDNKYLFINRGFCKCKLGDVSNGMIDLNKALEMGCEEARELIEEYSGE